MSGWQIVKLHASGCSLLLAPRVLLVSIAMHSSWRALSPDDVRQLLAQALADPWASARLRKAIADWGLDSHRIALVSDRELIAHTAQLTTNGPLSAFVVADIALEHPASQAERVAAPLAASSAANRTQAPAARPAASGMPTPTASAMAQSLGGGAINKLSPVPGPTPVAGPSTLQHTPATEVQQPVHSMDLMTRVKETLRLVPDHLTGETKEAFLALLEPQSLAMMAGVLAAWAAGHAFGVSEIIDAGLIAVGVAFLGKAIVDVARNLRDAFAIILEARSRADLDRAAKLIALVVATVGVAVFVALVTHAASKVVKGSVAKKGGTGTPPPEEPAAPRERIQKRPSPTPEEPAAPEKVATEEVAPEKPTKESVPKPKKGDPTASKPYCDNPESLKGRDASSVEKEMDQNLVEKGGWTKSNSADGNGIRYTDGKGGLVIVNKGYPEGLAGGAGDGIHAGPYVKIQPGNARVPLAGNPALGKN